MTGFGGTLAAKDAPANKEAEPKAANAEGVFGAKPKTEVAAQPAG
jgi:hypothetical protein